MLSTKKMKNRRSWGKFWRFLAHWFWEFCVLLLFCAFCGAFKCSLLL